MIKIYLNCLNYGFAEWEKDNKIYQCLQEFDDEKTIYSLYVVDATHFLRIGKPIKSESLTNINRWLALAKTEVEIAED